MSNQIEENENTIYLSSEVNEVFATTELKQFFTNPLKNAIELSVSFPIKPKISLIKFIVSIGEKIITSKVLAKEKAEEKYVDSIASGNIGFISRYDDDMSNYSINIGNILPTEKVKLTSIFIQMIDSQDMSYEYDIMEKYPSFHYKEMNNDEPKNKIIKANFKIKTQSKLTRLIAPFFDEEAKKNSTYDVKFNQDNTEANITYVKNPSKEENKNRFGGIKNGETNLVSFCILFRTEKMTSPVLYYQYNPEFKETSYSINYIYPSKSLKNIPVLDSVDQNNTISYSEKYVDNNTINETPGLFIFLIDQSGSMRGKSIDLVKQSLLLFIQSLPPKSYFQLIGFGSGFKKYNDQPVEYNKENVSNIINVINSLKADMGGTNISGPLDDIYKDINKNYQNINLSKNIFLLTDGQVHDREQCINLITTNSNKFRIHAIGIGNDFDKILIERSGKLGKGSSSFVEEVEKINTAVIETLNKCLRPYLTEIKFNFQNYQNNKKNVIAECNPVDNFTYQNEIMNYSFIFDENNKIDIDNLCEDIKIEIEGKDPNNLIKENLSFSKNKNNVIKLENGDNMSKMIIGKALKNNKIFTENENKEIEFAKKYQILSKNTALFAEILSDDPQQSKLIKVNLNENNSKGVRCGIMRPMMFCNAPMNMNMIKCCAAPTRCGAAPKRKMMKCAAAPKMNIMSCAAAPKIMALNAECDNIALPKKSIENKNVQKEKNNKNELTELIMSQDIIEGFWDENENTKKIINEISDKFKKIENKVKELKNNVDTKILFTISVIYYLNTKYADILADYKLVINKAKKYLNAQKINYDEFIAGL